MKNLFLKKTLLAILFISNLMMHSLAQAPEVKTIINLAPGITAPISYPNNGNPYRITPCDNADVRIFPSARPQSEIHLSINKQNPQVLLLSAQTFPINNSWQGAYWSIDGGLNWNGSDDLPNGAFGRGDPSTAFDAAGNGFIATMNATNINAQTANGYLIQRTNNNGATWQPQVVGTGVLNDFDKEMIAADDVPGSPFANNLYCAWSILRSPFQSDPSLVQFNRSTNQGINFSNPVTLRTGGGYGQGTNVQTGPNGEVYVCWADYASTLDWTSNGLGFCRSTDGGINFTTAQRVINYTGIRTFNPATNNDQNPDFNMIRVNDFPSMAVDKSNGVHRGRIYVALPVRENGNGRAIIQSSFSDNQGATWSTPTIISIANGRQSWFPWIAVDDTNGDIFVVYYSLDQATGFSTNTYVAVSNDGGSTFVNQRVSDVAHVTARIAEFDRGYAGDYIGITAHSGRAFASWMDNRTGQWQIYVSMVRDIDIVGDNVVCGTSNNYTLTNLPAGATVHWDVTPLGIATPNTPNAMQTTLTRNSNGIITLTATISNACGGTITVTKENIRVGLPTISSTYTYNGSQQPIYLWGSDQHYNPLCAHTTTYIVSNIQGASSVTWSKVTSTPTAIAWTQNSNGMQFNFWGLNQTAIFEVDATNACGTTAQQYGFQSIDCGSGGGCARFIITPNPAKSFFRIIKPRIPLCRIGIFDHGTIKNAAYFIQSVKIYDRVGNIQSQTRFAPNSRQQADINTSMLKTGIYFVDISDGKTTERHQLVITQ